MATTVQITGGAFQNAKGDPLDSGYLLFVLSQDAQIGTQNIAAGRIVNVPLDSNGDVSGTVDVWPNDLLSPVNTFYMVSAYSEEGQLVWGPNAQQVLSTPSPFDIGVWVPGLVNLV